MNSGYRAKCAKFVVSLRLGKGICVIFFPVSRFSCRFIQSPCILTIHPYVTVVTPVYGCAACLRELHRRLTQTLAAISPDYQIIFVNDQSPDDSWHVIEELAQADHRVLGLSLSRNFGQHTAITAGLDRADGEWVVVMDCDLQDQPEEINTLYAYVQANNLDLVLGRRIERQDKPLKKLFSRLFYAVLNYLSGTEQDPSTANFGIFHQRVVTAFRQMREPIRAFPIQVKWLGFRRGAVDIAHGARIHGKSGYNFSRLVDLAINIILAFSDKPLRLTIKLGLFISFGSFGFTLYVVGRALAGGYGVSGYASMIASIWLLGGMLMFVMGIVGLYVGKTFEGVKNRPLYILQQETSFAKNSLPTT